MSQAVIIQPSTPQQVPTSGSTGNKKDGQFAPHLENAISGNKKQQATRDSHKDTSTTSDEKLLTDQRNQLKDPQDSEKIIETEPTTTSETSEQNLLSPFFTDTIQPTSSSAVSQIRNVESSTNQQVGTPGDINPELNASAKAPGTYDILPELPPTNSDPKVLDPTKNIATSGQDAPKIGTTKQDALLTQLQQIIENADETGTVSITKAANTPTLHSINNNSHGVITPHSSNNREAVVTNTETTDLNLKGLLAPDAGVIDKGAAKPTQLQPDLRNDSQQQHYSAKLNTQNLSENNQNFQGSQAGDEFSQQTKGFNSQSGPVGTGEQTNTFSQISTIAQEAITQPATESAKPIMLPSGTIVYEDEIVHQLSQRFQLASKQMDSRITLKLNPAELGELKIDINLKEGSIRANVVAQSQQTLEILEKNIPKLKTILENQGFSVDEISVTNESESVGEFDLFDQQLFNQNDYTPTAQKVSREEEAIFTLDDAEFTAQVENTGVNVKI